MARWQICYADGNSTVVECDGIQPAEGGSLVFFKSLRVQSVDLNQVGPPNIDAVPITFVNLLNPNIKCVCLLKGGSPDA